MNTKKPIFIFIHGWGTNKNDLVPLQQSFEFIGYQTYAFSLYQRDNEQCEYFYQRWEEQLNTVINSYKEEFLIYLVGFSFGGTLAIDIASKRRDIEGIISISTFLRHSKHNIILPILNLLNRLKIRKIRRGRINTSNRLTIDQLHASKFINVSDSLKIFSKANEISNNFFLVDCPILFFHSVDDKVSEYKYLASVASSSGLNFRIVTIRELNHFIQFDIPSANLRDLAMVFFSLMEDKTYNIDGKEFDDYYSSMKNDEMTWSETVYKLLFGFFSIFGVLIYYTYEHIINNDLIAPYILITYSLVILIYILLVCIYFFYMNRTSSFIKHHLDPLVPHYSLISYKNNAFASGLISKNVTLKSTMVTVGLPLLVAIFLITYVPLKYKTCFSPYCVENFTMYIPYFFSIVFLIFDLQLIKGILRHSRIELFTIPQPSDTSLEFELYLVRLLNSIRPGCVKTGLYKRPN